MIGEEFGWNAGEDLSFAGKAAEGAGMQDASRIASEGAAVGVWGLGRCAPGEVA